MKPFFPIYYCILLLLSVNRGISQNNYSLRWYTSDNNELPQSSVKSITPDKYGFIWFSTENGIVRYDGNNFLVFSSSTINLRGSRFMAISGNIQSDSLYSKGQKELILINKRRIKTFANKKKYAGIIKNGKLYFQHDGIPSIATEDPEASYNIKLSDNKSYFISTKEIELCDSKMKRIYRMPFKNKSVFNFFTVNEILYYLKENGEYDRFSQNKIQRGKLEPLFNKNFKLYWNITARQVFLCTKNKIYLLTNKKEHLLALFVADFEHFNERNISSIFYDLTNSKLYVGSRTDGLCILSFTNFKVVKKNPKKTEVYYASLPFNKSSIITNNGLILNAEKVIDSISFKDEKYFNNKIAMAKDESKGIWLVQKTNLYRYLKESNYKKYIRYHFGQEIKTLYKDLDNNIWVSLQKDYKDNAKLYFISNKYSGKPKYILNSKFNINYIAQTKNKTLYLGTESGFFKYDIAKNRLSIIKKTENINVRSIFIDRNERIWFTTYIEGFFLYTEGRVYSFPKDKNKYLNSSHCIIEDKKGFFWISTNKGLFQVSKKSLIKYTEDMTFNIYYHYYNKTDGFLTNEFNGGCQPCGNYLESNFIAFPSMNGIVFFNPNNVKPILPNKAVFINRATVDQKTSYFNDTLILKNNFKRVKFFIDQPYYGNSNNLNLEAKLKGALTTQWERIGAEKSISYTTLPPGKYNLVVRNLSDFNSNYQYKKITIIIPPNFYQTIWFKVICYILGITCIVLLSRLRFYYLKEKNKQLEQTIAVRTQKLEKTIGKLEISQENLELQIIQQKRLIQTISHDIKSPLKYLVLTARHLYREIEKKDNESHKELTKSVYTSSFQLYGFVENLIKYSRIFIEGKKNEQDSYLLYKLVNTKVQLFEEVAQSENTQIINSIDKTQYLKTNSEIISIIIHNLLDNAIKNTKNGSIELLSQVIDNKFFIIVKDNGTGMDKELVSYYLSLQKSQNSNELKLRNYGLGMQMVIELIAILKGDLKITSEINKGTTIEIIIDYI
jgi:signal transduction histidine kinase